MYSSISINDTERKEIGIPILKRTNEMIKEFNLDYERHYKITKNNSEREKAFQEFLKKQEEHQFYLKKLIKLLKIYFKENNYNSDTYYFEYKHPTKSKYKKRRKKRIKSFILPKNKFIYYYLYKNSQSYNFHQPWIYPLGDRDKKKFIFKRIKTDSNLYKKKGIVQMSQNEMKLYIDMFGVIPVNYIKREKEKQNKKENSKLKSSYHFLRNLYYNSNTFDNKTHLLLKKGMKIKEQYFGNFNKMKKFVYMKNPNILNLKQKTTYRKLNNKSTISKRNRSTSNILYNKSGGMYNNYSTINLKKTINNTRYSNLQTKNQIMFKSSNNSYNLSSINSFSSFNKVKTVQNKHNNILSLDTKNNINNNPINTKKNISQYNIYKFKDQFSKTIKKSEIINKDISFLNKVFSASRNNYNKAKKILEKNKLKKISMVGMIKEDIRTKKRKALEKYKYVKENLSGNLKVNFLSFVREPQSKLIFVREYNKQREYINKFKDSYENAGEESSENGDYMSNYGLNKKNKHLLNPKEKGFIKFKLKRK